MQRVAEGEAIDSVADARRFNEFMGGNRFRQEEYRRLAETLVRMGIPPGGKVLDVGTGPGFVAIAVARLLRETAGTVCGLDLSPAMLELAAENAAGAGLGTVLSWRAGDAEAMPFGDSEFDAVVCNDSLHHWENPLPVLDEIARVLKADGICIVHDSKRPQGWAQRLFAWLIGRLIPSDFRVHYWNSLKSSYTPGELRAILERSRFKGWRIEEDFMDLSIVRGGQA
jgi:ubiquinone/menaquinone biosynthesis C-methylase UbiE